MTLDDIEAALWHRWRGADPADIDAIRAMVTDLVMEAGALIAEQEVTAWRRAELASANGLATHRGGGDRAAVLRAAHSEASRLRENGLPVPGRLAGLDREYWRNVKRAQRERAA